MKQEPPHTAPTAALRRRGGYRAALLALGALLAACGGVITPPHTVWAQESGSIYLVSHGWHVGLVIAPTDATAAQWPEQHDFPDAAFLEIGWGDRAYYQDPDPGLGKLLKAGLWPTPSVLHVVGFRRPVAAYFRTSEVIRIDLPGTGIDSLAAYVHAAYARDADERPIPLGPGLYGDSRFYAGRERYHAYKNCNTWTARALRAAGLPLRPAEVLTANDLLKQARPLGLVVQPAWSPDG